MVRVERSFIIREARRNFLREGAEIENYFALSKVQTALFTITFMSYMLSQF